MASTYRCHFEFLVTASRAEANQRVLVRKSLHQLHEYNHEQNNLYLEPVVTLDNFKWDKYTSGLSEEELADMEKAREKLENYKKIYEIYEYATDLNDIMFTLETQVSSNNPSYPMSIYRRSASTTMDSMIGDIEQVLEAYYSLIDESADYPDWQKKIILDLGGTVSYLALVIDDSSRDTLVETSEAFKRFDAEKQVYFK